MAASFTFNPLRWLLIGALVLLGITLFSTSVYYGLGHYYGRADWTFTKCLFMVVITLSTIGYGDILNLEHAELAVWFTMLLALIGVAVPTFVLSNIMALLFEGMLSDVLRRRHMEKKMAHMHEHLIVCGAGTTGKHVIEELLKTQRPFVVIDRNGEELANLAAELGSFLYEVGDATDDEVLKKAGVENASGLISVLTDDKENLFLVLSARRLNAKLKIVSKVIDPMAAPKMRSAGADRCINPTEIGGMRMVSELVRPTVVGFLDQMLRDRVNNYRLEELTVGDGSAMQDRTLGTSGLHDRGILVLAARKNLDDAFVYNPKADFKLLSGCIVVALGRTEDLIALRSDFAPKA